MEYEIIYNIVTAGGLNGVLIIATILLWRKIEAKENKIYELIEVIKENTNNQKQIIDLQKELAHSVSFCITNRGK